MFALRIPITTANLAAIKTELTKALPQVKSSHRVEGAARAFGFRTHASLLAATRSEHQLIGIPDGSAFVKYLADHRFNVEAVCLYRVAARVAIRAVLEQVPNLTTAGIGVGPPRRTPEGKWETATQHYSRLLEWRQEFFHESSAEQFLLALAFVQRIRAIKTIGKGPGSYGLKHIAEKYLCTYPDGAPLGPQYVSNGVLIAASVHAGFKFKKYVDDLGYDSLNVSFNMSKRSIDDLDREIRPNSSAAKMREHRRQYAAWRGGSHRSSSHVP